MNTPQLDDDILSKYRTDAEQAAYLNVNTRTLYEWRKRGEGPAWLRFPGGGRFGRILYRKESTAFWLAEQEAKFSARRAVA